MNALHQSIDGSHSEDASAVSGPVFLHVSDLADVDLAHIERIAAVFYQTKGAASHIEIVCRIKGIPLILESDATSDKVRGRAPDVLLVDQSVPPAAESAFASFEGSYQLSIFDPSDLNDVDFDRVETVFVRTEHLLYRIHAQDSAAFTDYARLSRALRGAIADLRRATPGRVRLLIRGSDVRSDDPILARYFFDGPETNPDLGRHGIRHLLEDPAWTRMELGAVVDQGPGVLYAVPFVTNAREFERFTRAFESFSDSLDLVPFAESPAVFAQMARYKGEVCLGLKDIAQFFFAADRSSAAVAAYVDFFDEDLGAQLAACVRESRRRGALLSIPQNLEILAHFTRVLGARGWVPSLAAGEFKRLGLSRTTAASP